MLTTPEMREIYTFIDTADEWHGKLQAILSSVEDDKKLGNTIYTEMIRAGVDEKAASINLENSARQTRAFVDAIEEAKSRLNGIQSHARVGLRMIMRARQSNAEASAFRIN